MTFRSYIHYIDHQPSEHTKQIIYLESVRKVKQTVETVLEIRLCLKRHHVETWC